MSGKSSSIWQERYFKLTTSKLLEYFAKKGGEKKGDIQIDGVKIKVAGDVKQNCFSLDTKDKKYFIAAPTEESMKEVGLLSNVLFCEHKGHLYK